MRRTVVSKKWPSLSCGLRRFVIGLFSSVRIVQFPNTPKTGYCKLSWCGKVVNPVKGTHLHLLWSATYAKESSMLDASHLSFAEWAAALRSVNILYIMCRLGNETALAIQASSF